MSWNGLRQKPHLTPKFSLEIFILDPCGRKLSEKEGEGVGVERAEGIWMSWLDFKVVILDWLSSSSPTARKEEKEKGALTLECHTWESHPLSRAKAVTSDLHNSYSLCWCPWCPWCPWCRHFSTPICFFLHDAEGHSWKKKSDFDLIYNIFSSNVVGFKSTAFYRSVSHYFKYNFCICYSQVWLTLEIQ